MKINKYNPPEELKNSVRSQITDDGYADYLLSLPETAKKKSYLLPTLCSAAAVILVIGVTVMALYPNGVKKDNLILEDSEESVGGTFDEYADAIEDGATDNTESGLSDSDAPIMPEGSVENNNSFKADEEESKGNGAIGTVTINDKTITLSADDTAKILNLLEVGEYVPVVCECVPRYRITIGTTVYTLHHECDNVISNGGMIRGIDVSAIDKIVSEYNK